MFHVLDLAVPKAMLLLQIQGCFEKIPAVKFTTVPFSTYIAFCSIFLTSILLKTSSHIPVFLSKSNLSMFMQPCIATKLL